MGWAIPNYSKSQVMRAGQAYVDPRTSSIDREVARGIIDNWRSSHSFPLNTIQINLRSRSTFVDAESLVAQRIKRLPSIRAKLERFPSMNLARMQDIGGCRSVVGTQEDVFAVTKSFLSGRHKHKLIRQDDYVATPKPSGYRSVHLVYAYHSDRSSTYNGLNIEVQIRSRLQHAWATAVETVGTFTQQALKSSQGEGEWLRFFQLMSSEIAHVESCNVVPGTPIDRGELRSQIGRLTRELDVVNRLDAYGKALQALESRPVGKYYLLQLDVPERTLTVYSYRELVHATDEYSAIERVTEGNPGQDVVLVSVNSLAALRRAYPNYFLDTSVFLGLVNEATT